MRLDELTLDEVDAMGNELHRRGIDNSAIKVGSYIIVRFSADHAVRVVTAMDQTGKLIYHKPINLKTGKPMKGSRSKTDWIDMCLVAQDAVAYTKIDIAYQFQQLKFLEKNCP